MMHPSATASEPVPVEMRGGPLERFRAAAPWLAVGLLAGWTRELSPWWLVGAAALLLFRAFPPARLRPSAALGVVLLLAAVASAFAAHHRLGRLSRDWDGWWEAREEAVFAELEARLVDVVSRGERTVRDLVLLVEESGGRPSERRLEALRSASDLAAVIVYGPDGDPVVWSGTHRGRVPDAVQLGLEPYVYGELPLFSYLYFTAHVGSTGGTAVVPYLLRTELPSDLGADPGDLVSRFREDTGETIRISTAERAAESAVYDFGYGDETLFSVSIERPAQAERMAAVRADWIRAVAVLLGAGAFLLALSLGGARRSGAAPALALALLLAVLPWPLLLNEPELFSAADFLLPSPGTVTLGRLLALALSGCVIAGWLAFQAPGPAPGALAALLVAVGFPLGAWLVGEGATADFLAASERDWVIYQATLAALLTLVAAGAFALDRRGGGERWALRVALSALGAVALAAACATWVRSRGALPVWPAALWAVPVYVALPALRAAGTRRPLLLWLGAGVLAVSAALPYGWAHRVEARTAVGDAQLGRLGAGVDPYLEELLLPRLGAAVDSLHRQGASPIELLFRLASGLAEEGYPVWTTLWSSGGIPLRDLSIGVADRPSVAIARPEPESERREGEVDVRRYADPAAHYRVQVSLGDGSVVSGIIPPSRGSAPFSPLAYLFGSLSDGRPDPLELVPLAPGDSLPARDRAVWVATDDGLSGEAALVYPASGAGAAPAAGARYHARYRVDLSAPPILVARATLLLALDLAVLLLAWGAGGLFSRRVRPAGGAPWRVLTTFRARVTLALFAFFGLSLAIFGTIAYRNIADAAERAAEVLAERVAQDAAELYLEVGGMQQIAQRVGGELLAYRNGQLAGGAAEEPVELGLYEGLVPYDVHAALGSGRELMATRAGALGRWAYVTAYRRLADGTVLSVPVPLQAGATAVRRREVADLLLFAVIAGAGLSLVLALLVGRTLTRPIRTLQVASERVGSGNLGVRLRAERSDEFGAVFAAFNRMVRRLRRARADLVRTTRRTQAIVEDAATGVIALDPYARVTLVNPRAVALLGLDVPVGQPLSGDGGHAAELVRWVELYYRDRLPEAATELQLGQRRIRVRARRITQGGDPEAGAVLSLEDVTDELRAERILAWGEMARQVAHEVKNPLTPIKLSIQHIRRAHQDRRPDFDDILSRNADAMLREIERLAAIASSFSRFGAPNEVGQGPLEGVSLAEVAGEVLALYSNGEGRVRFRLDVSPGLPRVRARAAEVKEVLVNLLENARAAIEDEGTVVVEAVPIDDGVVLRVRDDGSGIPPELLPRIFEPHFSTRSSGTGLGLAIVRRLAESWDATVTAESEPGRGTVFHVRLRRWSSDGAQAPAWTGRGGPDA